MACWTCSVGSKASAERRTTVGENDFDIAAERLGRFFHATTELMQIMARACGHERLSGFCKEDIATWHYEVSRLSGIAYSGALA